MRFASFHQPSWFLAICTHRPTIQSRFGSRDLTWPFSTYKSNTEHFPQRQLDGLSRNYLFFPYRPGSGIVSVTSLWSVPEVWAATPGSSPQAPSSGRATPWPWPHRWSAQGWRHRWWRGTSVAEDLPASSRNGGVCTCLAVSWRQPWWGRRRRPSTRRWRSGRSPSLQRPAPDAVSPLRSLSGRWSAEASGSASQLQGTRWSCWPYRKEDSKLGAHLIN